MDDFNKWLKSKFIRPTIPLVIIPIILGVLNFFGKDFFELKNLFHSLGIFPDSTSNDSILKHLFSFLNFTFALYVIMVSANKYKKANEEEDEEFTEKEKSYFQYLSLKKGQLFSTSNSTEDWRKFKKGVNKTIRQFTCFWVLAWIFYTLIYFLKLDLIQLSKESEPLINNLLNNLGSLMFIFLFMTLTISTSKRKWFSWTRFILIILIISLVEYFNKDYSLYFGIISGLFGGLALALFVTSIDSKFANIPIWVTTSLSFYALIQIFYLITNYSGLIFQQCDVSDLLRNLEEKVIPIILCLVLIFKIILFWVVTWLLRTNRLLFVVFEEGSLNFQREINFENFNKIISTRNEKLL